VNHSAEKHRRLYCLLKEKAMLANRHDLVFAFSDGTTENSAELTQEQIDDLIEHLQSDGPEKNSSTGYNGNRMRRRIMSMCYSIGWTRWDEGKKRHIVDMERLDGWMKKYSHLHKGLNEYKYNELPVVVTQFENLMKSEL